MRVVALSAIVLAAACAAFTAPGRAEDTISEARLERLFRPVQGERMALSSDGHYLAYTEQVKKELVINIMDLEQGVMKSRLSVDEDRETATGTRRAALRFMEWATGDRLVYAPNPEVIPSGIQSVTPEMKELGISIPEPTVLAPIMIVNADGTGARQILNLREMQYVMSDAGQVSTPVPLIRSFSRDRKAVLIETRGNLRQGITTKTYRLELETAKLSVVDEDLLPGQPIYDRDGRMRLLANNNPADYSTWFEYHPPQSKKWAKLPEPVIGGRKENFTKSPANYLGERAIALGFDYDPNVLIYASNVGRDTYGIYGLDLTTLHRTALALEHPHRDLAAVDAPTPSATLVFDKFRQTFVGVRGQGPRPLTVWCDPELAEVQRVAEEKFPQRSVRLLEWDEARTRFLTLVTGGTEPGRTYLFQRPEGLMVEIMRRTPWLMNAELHDTRYFEFATKDGTELTGFITTPRRPRISPPPLIVWLAPGVPPLPHPEFDPQAQVFADMGFIVCRLNNRGVLGLGTTHREALRKDIETASAVGQDAVATVEWLASQQKIDRKRIVMAGEGFSGHLALRATQLHPGFFRCAIVFEPVINLMSWTRATSDLDVTNVPTLEEERRRVYLEGNGAQLSKVSVTAHGDELNVPTLIITRRDRVTEADQRIAAGVNQLRSLLKQHHLATATVEINANFAAGMAKERTQAYREMEEFLNLNLYNFDVKIGPTKELK